MIPINFAVPLPAAGANAILCFEFADLEQLEADLDVGYLSKIAAGAKDLDTATIRKCVAIAVKGGDPVAALNNMPLADLCIAITTALSLRLFGSAS